MELRTRGSASYGTSQDNWTVISFTRSTTTNEFNLSQRIKNVLGGRTPGVFITLTCQHQDNKGIGTMFLSFCSRVYVVEVSVVS